MDLEKYEDGKVGLGVCEFNGVECIKDWREGFDRLGLGKDIEFGVKGEGDGGEYVMVGDGEKIEGIR